MEKTDLNKRNNFIPLQVLNCVSYPLSGRSSFPLEYLSSARVGVEAYQKKNYSLFKKQNNKG